MNCLKRKKKQDMLTFTALFISQIQGKKIEGGSAFLCELLETVKLYEIIVTFSILEENLCNTQMDFFFSLHTWIHLHLSLL